MCGELTPSNVTLILRAAPSAGWPVDGAMASPPTRATAASIPPEIIALILAHLPLRPIDDLRRAAEIAPCWTAEAHTLLFRSVSIHSQREMAHWLDAFEGGRVGTYVKELSVRYRGGLEVLANRDDSTWRLLQHTKNVTSLTLSSLPLFHSFTTTQTASMQTTPLLPALHTLVLYMFSPNWNTAIHAMLATAPNIVELTVDCFPAYTGSEWHLAVPSLRKLNLASGGAQEAFLSGKVVVDLPALEELDLGMWRHGRDLAYSAEFARRIGSTLLRLRISARLYTSLIPILSQLSVLEYLRLGQIPANEIGLLLHLPPTLRTLHIATEPEDRLAQALQHLEVSPAPQLRLEHLRITPLDGYVPWTLLPPLISLTLDAPRSVVQSVGDGVETRSRLEDDFNGLKTGELKLEKLVLRGELQRRVDLAAKCKQLAVELETLC